jgi:hypothetical protein
MNENFNKMKKPIYTHCQNPECGKMLSNPNSISKYCRNGNKCKNDFHNSMRRNKVEFADQIIEYDRQMKEYDRILTITMKNRRIKSFHYDEFNLLGIDLYSDVLEIVSFCVFGTYIELRYKSFVFLYSVESYRVYVLAKNNTGRLKIQTPGAEKEKVSLSRRRRHRARF